MNKQSNEVEDINNILNEYRNIDPRTLSYGASANPSHVND